VAAVIDFHADFSAPCRRKKFGEGARIILTGPADIPNEIDLYIPKRKRIAHASVRWRHGDKLGLALFEVGHARRSTSVP
jgi:hypothetical protein